VGEETNAQISNEPRLTHYWSWDLNPGCAVSSYNLKLEIILPVCINFQDNFIVIFICIKLRNFFTLALSNYRLQVNFSFFDELILPLSFYLKTQS
jgi:hypothetical protein